MRASTHEQADADEPANPICQPICRLNVAFVAVRASVLPLPRRQLATTSQSRCSQSEVLYAKLASRLGGRAPTNRFGKSQHLRCVRFV